MEHVGRLPSPVVFFDVICLMGSRNPRTGPQGVLVSGALGPSRSPQSQKRTCAGRSRAKGFCFPGKDTVSPHPKFFGRE